MILSNCIKVVLKLQSIKMVYHGLEIKVTNTSDHQIVKQLNGLIQKINILLSGWELQGYLISRNCGVGSKLIWKRGNILCQLITTITLQLGKVVDLCTWLPRLYLEARILLCLVLSWYLELAALLPVSSFLKSGKEVRHIFNDYYVTFCWISV